MNAACALGMDSFILTSINIFPELTLDLLAAGRNGDMLRAKNIQEKLSSAVLVITKHGKYCFSHLAKCIVTKNWSFAGNWVQTMKTAMSLLTEINVGLPRAPLKSISSDALTTMITDLTNLGYQAKLKHNWKYFDFSLWLFYFL